MLDKQRLTGYPAMVIFHAIDSRDGQERVLRAKLICELIVFAGGEHGSVSVPANSELWQINQAWVAYCAQNNASGQANPDRIDQGDLDRARGIF